jgi:hypothetical protein
MAEKIEANRLVKLRTRLHDEDTMVLILEDDKSKRFACFANQDQLNTLLNAILSSAGNWSEKPSRASLSFEQSSNSTECAVRLSLTSKIKLKFVLPLNETIRGMAEFVRSINRSRQSDGIR